MNHRPEETKPKEDPKAKKKQQVVVRYAHCCKNHAVSIGKHVTDGCQEFMPCDGDKRDSALRCTVCGCHRNFHRKMVEEDDEVARKWRSPAPPVAYYYDGDDYGTDY